GQGGGEAGGAGGGGGADDRLRRLREGGSAGGAHRRGREGAGQGQAPRVEGRPRRGGAALDHRGPGAVVCAREPRRKARARRREPGPAQVRQGHGLARDDSRGRTEREPAPADGAGRRPAGDQGEVSGKEPPRRQGAEKGWSGSPITSFSLAFRAP